MPAVRAFAKRVLSLAFCCVLAVVGVEVVQVYVVDPVMAYVRPWKRLVGFARVLVAPADSQRVHVAVLPEDLAFQDDSSATGVSRAIFLFQLEVRPAVRGWAAERAGSSCLRTLKGVSLAS